MPLYECECEVCGAGGDFIATIAECNNTPCCEACGGVTKRAFLTAPMAIVRFPAAGGHEYISPVSGRAITTQKARRDDLARTGSRPYEGFATESKEAQRRVAADEKKSDAKLHDDVSRAYHQLTPEKRKIIRGAV